MAGARHRARLLLACVRGQAWQDPSPAVRRLRAAGADGGFPAAASFHGVAGYAYRSLRLAGGTEPATLAQLEGLRAGALHTHLRALGDLPWLGEVLGAADVRWLVVKGPVLAAMHGAPDLRAYGDLDVVVPAASFATALSALERAGARVLAHNWWHRLDVVAGEVPVALPSGTLVDLHWHLLNDADLRREFTLSMPALFARAREVDVGGWRVTTLGDVDTTLALVLHTAASGANRLVWLKDTERLLAVERPDPHAVAAAAADAGLALVAATVLDKTRTTLATDVADPVLDALRCSRTWRGVAALARRLSPPERARRGGSVDRIVSRATRRDLPSSLGELARRSARWRARAPADTERRSARDLDPGQAADGRRAFLGAVSRQP